MAGRGASRIKARGPFSDTVKLIRRYWYCYVMISGTFALLVAFSYIPAVSAIYHSLTVWDGFRPPRWVGLKNYREIFGSDVVFVKAFKNMALLVSWEVVRTMVFPLMAAVLIYRLRSERLAYFFRLLFVLPIVVPALVSILVWRQLFDPNVGLLNEIIGIFGIGPSNWLNAERTALPSLMLMGFPWIHGIDTLIYLAGLLAIPTEIIEAALVDGVGRWRRFFSMELPLIVPQIRLIVIVNSIYALQGFGWQLLVTRGGPNNATTVPAWEMYRSAMEGTHYGMASAIGVVLFALILTLTLINNSFIRSTVEYQAE